LIISRSILLKVENIPDKNYRENQRPKIFFSRKCAVYEIIWKNMVEPNIPQMAIWRMRFACCITKATDTISDYVILIVFPLLQWLGERAILLCCTYIVCLVMLYYYIISNICKIFE